MIGFLQFYVIIGLILVGSSYGVATRPSDISRREYVFVIVMTIFIWPLFVIYMARSIWRDLKKRRS